jgi:glycosyltransferase involved in cell wall biosynthesis
MVFSEVLDHLVVTERIDLVSLHWLSYDTGDLIRRAASAQIPIVVINHFENSRLSLRQSRKWLTHAAAVGTVSGQDIPGDLTHRTCNLSDAVNTDFFDPQRAKPTLPVGRPVIFLPARIQTGKGHHDLIQAARILNARNLNFSLCFTGAVDSQSLHEELDGCDATCGLEGQILFLGEISAVDIRDWYARSSVVVLPSRSEGLPRVLLEAQAMKKPVVAYDCGGIREAMVPDKTGFLVKAGDLEDLASKIAFLLENEPQRLRMGECGREFVTQQFSVSALIQRHEAFYVNALSNARAGHRSLTGR